MTQEEFKEQAKNYIDYNLNNQTKLEVITDILDDISNNLYENGYTKESNTLTTCLLNIKGILKEGDSK